MNFLSLFAGIGGFELGFERAGMTCKQQVEIDDNCNTVLAYHWPDIERLKDVRDAGRHNLEAVDLVCGGFPCQDVSVAGRREGLDGERSGLWFEFIRVVEELEPKWVVVENVPGLLSSNDKRDFAAVLSGLGKRGYWWAYRVLDAQYYGVPQRRRRVFIVGCLARGRAQEVLFERQSSPWDTAPGREKRKDITGSLAPGAHPGGITQYEVESNLAVCVAYQCHSSDVGPMGTLRKGKGDVQSGVPFICNALDGHSGGPDDNDAQGNRLIPFDTTQITSCLNRNNPQPGDPCHPLAKGAHPPAIAFRTNQTGAQGPIHSEEITDTLAQDHPPAVVFDKQIDTCYNQGISQEGSLSNASTQETNAREILSILRQKIGEEAFAEWELGILDSLQQAEILRPPVHGKGVRGETENGRPGVDDCTLSRKEDSGTGTVREVWVARCLRRASQEWELEGQFARELGAYLSQLSQQGSSQASALQNLWEASEGLGVLRQALSEIQEIWRPATRKEKPTYSRYGVRRLTPLEAERLQGFPDGWTAVDGMSDSARYRMLGNAVCVPVAEWIGRQIVMVEREGI